MWLNSNSVPKNIKINKSREKFAVLFVTLAAFINTLTSSCDFRSRVIHPHVNYFAFELHFSHTDAVLMQRCKLRMVELVSIKAARYLLCPLKEEPHSHRTLKGVMTKWAELASFDMAANMNILNLALATKGPLKVFAVLTLPLVPPLEGVTVN